MLGLLGHYTAVSEAATMSSFDKNSSTFISAFRHIEEMDCVPQPPFNLSDTGRVNFGEGDSLVASPDKHFTGRGMNIQDGTEFQQKLNTDVDLTGLLAPCTNGSTKTEHHQQPPMVCSGLRQVCRLGCEKRFQEKQRMKF